MFLGVGKQNGLTKAKNAERKQKPKQRELEIGATDVVERV
jgi:hypothetical protein